MKWVVADGKVLSGLAVVDAEKRPPGAYCIWPDQIDPKFAEVAELMIEHAHDAKGNLETKSIKVQISDFLAQKKVNQLPEDQRDAYQKEIEKMGIKVVVVHDSKSPNGVSLVRAEDNVKPQNFIANAPDGFKPGDEQFVKKAADGKSVSFDVEAQRKAPIPKPKKGWNEQSVLERLKEAYGRRK